MGRYKWSMWRTEESSTPSGDNLFVGIDEVTSDDADLAPGFLRVGQNIRIENAPGKTGGSPATRGGLALANSFNFISYAQIFGRGIYADSNGTRWMLIVVSTGVWAVSDGQAPKFIAMPTGFTIQSPCEPVEVYNVVILFFGPTVPPLYWNGQWGSPFTQLPNAATGYVTIPSAVTAEFASDRIIVPFGRDGIAVSKIGDYASYSNNFNNFNINQGEDDVLVRVKEWQRGNVLFFKGHNIYQAQNFSGDLSNMILNRIPGNVGLVGRKALVEVGADLFFMDYAGVYRIMQIFENTPEVKALPISNPLKNTIKDINWPYAGGIVAAARKDRVYFAIPLGSSTRNNAMIVYNIVRESWESVDTFPNTPSFGIDDILEMEYNGERRLFALDMLNGFVYVMENDSPVDYFTTTPGGGVPIYTWIKTRGYSGPAVRANYRHLKVVASTWNPKFSLKAYTSGMNEAYPLVSNNTRSNTTYYTFGKAPWAVGNINKDWNTPFRQDYHVDTSLPLYLGSGIIPDQKQEAEFNYSLRCPGRYAQLEVINIQGAFELRNVTFESWEDQRQDRGQA